MGIIISVGGNQVKYFILKMNDTKRKPSPGAATEYMDLALFLGPFEELEIFHIGLGTTDYMNNREILSVRKHRQTT